MLNIFLPKKGLKLIGKLIEEIKLRKHSYKTARKYRDNITKFLKSGKMPRIMEMKFHVLKKRFYNTFA